MKLYNKLVFKSDFSKDGKPNPSEFTHQIGAHKWGNREEQYYTDSLDNCFVKNGKLHIIAKKESINDTKYTSARLTTQDKHHWTYGKFEITAKLPKGKGSWPAIWMLPDTIRQYGWPKCGEIDIMEHVGKDQDMVHFSLHSQLFNHIKKTQMTKFLKFDSVSDTFHKYGMIWDEKHLAFYVDDVLTASFEKKAGFGFDEWPFDQPYHLILNIAVGGTWGGEVDESMLPFEMIISKIEVFQ